MVSERNGLQPAVDGLQEDLTVDARPRCQQRGIDRGESARWPVAARARLEMPRAKDYRDDPRDDGRPRRPLPRADAFEAGRPSTRDRRASLVSARSSSAQALADTTPITTSPIHAMISGAAGIICLMVQSKSVVINDKEHVALSESSRSLRGFQSIRLCRSTGWPFYQFRECNENQRVVRDLHPGRRWI